MSNDSSSRRRWGARILSLAAACGLAGPLSAAEPEVTLEEVVVTAQKRLENLQTVPLALSVFSAESLEKENVSNLTDLRFRIPSLVYLEETTGGSPSYYIRGIGSNLLSPAADSDVGVFIDGVYMSQAEMTNNDFLDLERVEVLRGPQGTLFGRNVVGGAISFVTRKPNQEFRAGGNVTVGNYHERDAGGYVSGPLSDTFFGKLAVIARDHDGYFFNTTTGNDVEDTRFVGTRGALRFMPNESLDIQLNADASRRRGTGNWSIITTPGPIFTAPPQPDPYRGAHGPDDGRANVDNRGVSLNVDWQTAPGTVTSITAYRASKYDGAINTTGHFARPLFDFNPADGSNIYVFQQYLSHTDQFSQELRLASPQTDRFNWVAGLYYFDANTRYVQNNQYRFVDFFSEGTVGFRMPSKTTSYAAFANGKLAFTDKLGVQAGVRWSRDKRDAAYTTLPGGVPFNFPINSYTVDGVPVAGFSVDASKDWSAVTPTASLNYQLTPEKFLYATVSRGYKSGGFSGDGEQAEARSLQQAFNPEYAWNYEVGAKTEWLDRRLRFNASVFYIDYTDLQLLILVQLFPLPSIPNNIIGNAGKAVSKGVETEWEFLVTPRLSVYGNYTYTDTDTEIKELILDTVTAVNLAGNRLSRAPKNKVFAGVSYTAPLGDAFNVIARVDYSYSSQYDANPRNDPLELVDSSRNLGAGLSFEGRDGRWGVDLWGKNLTNDFHASLKTDVFGTGYSLPIDPPRTYGATVRFQF